VETPPVSDTASVFLLTTLMRSEHAHLRLYATVLEIVEVRVGGYVLACGGFRHPIPCYPCSLLAYGAGNP
jgi:hypothetical protein